MGITNKIQLESLDSLFGEVKDGIKEILLSDLHCFKNHPFKVIDDEKMNDMVDSIKEYGILSPILVRKASDNNGYEIISGHRRKHACELLGLKSMPCIARKFTDDEAIIMMVDSNLQREEILPSEKAFSFKMKLEAMKRQGKREDLTSSQVGTKLRADEELAEQFGESRNQIQRYVRLTYLTKELLNMVDEKKIPINVAYEISFLSEKELEYLWLLINEEMPIPSIKQAQKLKELSKNNKLTNEVMEVILAEEKEVPKKVSLKANTLSQYFPPEYSQEQIEDIIIDLLEDWAKNNNC